MLLKPALLLTDVFSFAAAVNDMLAFFLMKAASQHFQGSFHVIHNVNAA